MYAARVSMEEGVKGRWRRAVLRKQVKSQPKTTESTGPISAPPPTSPALIFLSSALTVSLLSPLSCAFRCWLQCQETDLYFCPCQKTSLFHFSVPPPFSFPHLTLCTFSHITSTDQVSLGPVQHKKTQFMVDWLSQEMWSLKKHCHFLHAACHSGLPDTCKTVS